MSLDDYILHWAKLIRESSDDFDSSELQCINPEVNGLPSQCESKPHSGGSKSHSVGPNHKPDDAQRTKSDRHIVVRSAAFVNGRIKDIRNGDKTIDFSDLRKALADLKRALGLCYWSASYYLKIDLGANNRIMFRLANHPANGYHFSQEEDKDCSRFMSVYIEGNTSPHKPTPVPYTEVRYTEDAFKTNPRQVVASLIDQIENFINNKQLNPDPKIATVASYQKEIYAARLRRLSPLLEINCLQVM